MDNEFEYITSSHPNEPEPVPFREKHPNLFWFGVTVAAGRCSWTYAVVGGFLSERR